MTTESLDPEIDLDGLTAEEQREVGDLRARLAEHRAELDRIEEEALADDATLDLTLEEVAALAAALDREPPAPVRPGITMLAAQPGWEARIDTASRGLQARHLLGSDGRPADPVARMLELFDEPVLVGHVEFEVADATYEFHLCADEEAAGEIVALASGLHRFSVFPLSELVARLVVRSGLMARPHEPGVIALRTGAFIDLVNAVATGADPVEQLCAHPGVDPGVAARYVAATEERLASAVVTVLTCTEPGVLEGGALSWLDGGIHGLWRLPDQESATGALDEIVETRAVEAEDLLSELVSYLGVDTEPA